MAASGVQQPIIRGIQAVGSVQIKYRYNKEYEAGKYALHIPKSIRIPKADTYLKTIPATPSSDFLAVSGFRLSGEFLRANPQIASSFVIPLLGGGGVALTNNNRTGTLVLNCTKVSTPNDSGYMKSGSGSGPVNKEDEVYDLVTLAQIQQSQEAGDSYGATILIAFNFCGETTLFQFEGCTVATVDPIGLAGDDAVNYNVAFNYLNWRVAYNATTVTPIV